VPHSCACGDFTAAIKKAENKRTAAVVEQMISLKLVTTWHRKANPQSRASFLRLWELVVKL